MMHGTGRIDWRWCRCIAPLVARCTARLTVLVAVLGTVLGTVLGAPLAAPLEAQVFVGTVTDASTNEPIPGVLVTLQDSAQSTLAQIRTLQDGRFALDGKGVAKVRFAIRKLGARPSYSGFYEVPAGADTLQVELSAPVTGVMIATVTTTADARRKNSNVDRLTRAERNNWQVVQPWKVAEERRLSNSLTDLMRRLPLPGIRVPTQAGDCFSNKRAVRRMGSNCVYLVVDDMLLNDPFLHINATDIHFFAFVPGIQARVLWGAQAMDGVIYIATRKQGDNEERPKATP